MKIKLLVLSFMATVLAITSGCVTAGKHTLTRDGDGKCEEKYTSYHAQIISWGFKAPTCNSCNSQVPRYTATSRQPAIVPPTQSYAPAPHMIPVPTAPQAPSAQNPCPCQNGQRTSAQQVSKPAQMYRTAYTQPNQTTVAVQAQGTPIDLYYYNGQYWYTVWDNLQERYVYMPYRGPVNSL